MWMTNEEVARSYRNSKRRGTQIRILAELNLCQPQEIKEILVEMGEIKEKKVKTEGEDMKVPEVIIQLAVEKLDSIEEEIKVIEAEIKKVEEHKQVLEAQYAQIAEFLDGR